MDGDAVYRLVGISIYLLILMGIGVAASRRIQDVRDYFAAGKSLGFFSVAFSARATGESAWLLLGLTGMGAAIGVKAFWVVLGETLGVTVAWLVMSRRFKRLSDRYDSITVPDYLESRFRDENGHRNFGRNAQWVRIVAAFALTVFVTIYVSAQIDATGQAFEDFLGWNYFVGALVGFAIVVVYITSGGFLAVAWSDVFQGALMVIGLVALPIVGVIAAGGWTAVSDGLSAVDPALMAWDGGLGWTATSVAGILSLALIGLGFMGSPQIFARFIALRSEDEISKGATVAIVWTLLADGGAVLVGMIGRHVIAGSQTLVDSGLGANGENVLPLLVSELMPGFIVGIYIAIVLSAIMSTVDSLLIVAASAAVRDFHQKVRHPELGDDELVGLSRKVTIVLALCALTIAMGVALTTEERSIFWFVIFGWSGISATFCPVMILSLFWAKMTARGAVAGMVAGFVGVPLFKFAAPQLPMVGAFFKKLGELPPSFLLSALAIWLVSMADREGQKNLDGIEHELIG